jgi:16S rRNA G527 N7-methylase RsmG
VSFLREAIRTIPLERARAVELRAEAAGTDPDLAAGAALVVGRGLRLDVFLTLAAPLLEPSGRIVAMQTPATAVGAKSAGGHQRLHLIDRHDYVLPGRRQRSILLYALDRVS